MKSIVVGGIKCEVTREEAGRDKGVTVWAPRGMCFDGGEHHRDYRWSHAKFSDAEKMAKEDLEEAELQECDCEECYKPSRR